MTNASACLRAQRGVSQGRTADTCRCVVQVSEKTQSFRLFRSGIIYLVPLHRVVLF